MCECSCGGSKIVSQRALLLNKTRSCGCLRKSERPNRRKPIEDLSNRKINQWQVLHPDTDRLGYYICECDCGTRESVSAVQLDNRRAKCCSRCSAVARVQSSRGPRPHTHVHGYASRYADARQRLTYISWRDMLRRVDTGESRLEDGSPTDVDPAFRQIKNLVAAVGLRPSREYTLNRISNARGYWPDNLEWADKKTQAVNRTTTVFIDIWRKRFPKSDWQQHLGFNRRELATLLQSHPQRGDLTRLVLDTASHLVQKPIDADGMKQLDEFVDELMQLSESRTIPTEEV